MMKKFFPKNKRAKKQGFSHCNFFPKNRKGTDKVLSIYWFAILVLVAGGVFAMVTTFYSYPYDVREVETEFFADKIADCISEKGVLNSDLVAGGEFNEEFSENFLIECGINFNSEFEEEQYYFEIDFYDLTNLDKPFFKISNGNANYKADCGIEEEYKRFAMCVEKRFYSVDELNNQYLIKILSIVAKINKNVK